MAKQIYPSSITGMVTSLFAWLSTPDTKFKEQGEYYITVAVPRDSKEFAQIQAFLTPLLDKASENAKEGAKPAEANKIISVAPWTPETDADGEETGRMKLRFKQQANVTRKSDGKVFHIQPLVYDTKGAQIMPTDIPVVGMGSNVRVSYEVSPYLQKGDPKRGVPPASGVSLRLKAVQIVDLVNGRGASAADFGFGEEEGSFVSREKTPFDGEASGTGTGDF